MRKGQRYNKEEMYLAVEMWQESGLTQLQFCSREKLSKATFGYWLKKYRKEKGLPKPATEKAASTFIPVKVTGAMDMPALGVGQIAISYPNGVQVTCPVSLNMQQLKTLINL